MEILEGLITRVLEVSFKEKIQETHKKDFIKYVIPINIKALKKETENKKIKRQSSGS